VSRFAWILMPLLLAAAPLASAEIYKCIEKNGVERYQNFPCPIDSLGSLPSTAPGAKTPSAPAVASRAKPAAARNDAASTAKVASASEPRAGMTPDEVRAIWGEPEETIQDEPVDGRIEIWRYADGRSVQFNNKHRVLAVQR
jgi:Domain of unknown function (DUF4124)